MNNNAAIYGPPAHTPDTFNIRVQQDPTSGAWNIIAVQANSPTHRTTLWSLGPEHFKDWAGDDANRLNVAQEVYVLLADLIQSQPGTEARAAFVASGGLYEQLQAF